MGKYESHKNTHTVCDVIFYSVYLYIFFREESKQTFNQGWDDSILINVMLKTLTTWYVNNMILHIIILPIY